MSDPDTLKISQHDCLTNTPCEKAQDTEHRHTHSCDAADSPNDQIKIDIEDASSSNTGQNAAKAGQAESASSSTASSVGIGNKIFMHFELLDSSRHRAGQAVFLVMLALGGTCLGISFYVRKHDTADPTLKGLTLGNQSFLHKLYVGLGSTLFSACAIMGIFCVRSLFKVKHCLWTRRQRYLVAVINIKLLCQAVNLIFWLVPNAYALAYPCKFFSVVSDISLCVRLSCWNTVCMLQVVHIRNCKPALKKSDGPNSDPVPDVDNPYYGNNCRDPMLLDAPFVREHWLILSLWALAGVAIVVQVIIGSLNWYKKTEKSPSICPGGSNIPVDVRPEWRVMSTVDGCALILYQAFCGLAPRIYAAQLGRQSYTTYQFANLLMMWQALAIADTWSILNNSGTLVSYLQSWYGRACVQVILSSYGVLDAFYLLPMEARNEEHIYKTLLQRFVWTRDQVSQRQQRFQKYTPGYSQGVHQQPVFCMQTAMELLLWSNVCYERDPEGGQPAMSAAQAALLKESISAQHLYEAEAPRRSLEPGSPFSGRRRREDALEAKERDSQLRRLFTSRRSKEGVDQPGNLDRRASTSPKPGKRKAEVLVTQQTLQVIETRLSRQVVQSADNSGSPEILHTAAQGQAGTTPVGRVLYEEGLESSEEQIRMGMKFFDLDNLKIFTGTKTDTKAVLAWGNKCMVLAFRGTSSMANVSTDAKAWRTKHLPKRGNYWLCNGSLVHKGFQRAWLDVQSEIMQAIKLVLGQSAVPVLEFDFYVTGHSLGGCLSQLACWSIQNEFHLPNLICYTFGAPRPGNAAFAKEFRHLVPNMYHVINDRDPVSYAGKALLMYKRPGHRVLINSLGDIRVRPTIFEISLHAGGLSVTKHFLEAYMDSLGAVCVAQFIKSKALEGGLDGVKKLAEIPHIDTLLRACGIELKHLIANPPTDFQKAVKHVKTQDAKSNFKNNLASLARELKNLPIPLSSEE